MTAEGAIHVAVAVLRRGDGRILVAERCASRHQGGGLEFPGGKLDSGETVAAALARELDEELGVRLDDWTPFLRIRHRYPDRSVVLHVGLVEDWSGEPRGAERQRIEWRSPGSLRPEDFPAANRPVMAALQLPACCLVTPDRPEDEAASVIDGLGRAFSRGPRLVELRAPRWGERAWERLLATACEQAVNAPHEIRLIARTADPAWLERFPALSGLHLSASAAHALRERPLPADRLLSCACHDTRELRRAEALGADIAVVGHVQPTPGHTDKPALGWPGFESLVAESALPVYAIGGLAEGDLERARRHGAIGIAAIRGLWEAC